MQIETKTNRFDSVKKSLHNLVSLLLTQWQTRSESDAMQYMQCLLFNNETTDKCGRLVAQHE